MSAQPLLLDLFAGAGGAGEGYARAGFKVVGVDLNPKPLRHNSHECYEGDALAVLDTLLDGDTWQGYSLWDFAAGHNSPPCQGYSVSKGMAKDDKPLLIGAVRERMERWQRINPNFMWVIENVTGARSHLPSSAMLCGTHFGLHVYRHRYFESSHMLFAPSPCNHPPHLLDGYYAVYGSVVRGRQTGNRDNHYTRYGVAVGREAMGIDWMTQLELSQAIPPAYTLWLGQQLMTVLEVAA